jgi:hypothetical protein
LLFQKNYKINRANIKTRRTIAFLKLSNTNNLDTTNKKCPVSCKVDALQTGKKRHNSRVISYESELRK